MIITTLSSVFRMKKNNPTISILIVNFNGINLLEDCLTSINKLDYPKNKIEIIFVDNDSKDNSVEYVRKKFPKVKVIESKTNLGFAQGNNIAYENSTGEYIILLNTDTKVDKQWLRALVDAAQPKNIGIISSKLLFATKFLELTITSKIVSKSSLDSSIDFSPVGVIIEDLVCKNKSLNHLIWYESGFYNKKSSTINTRWCKDSGKILLPFGENAQESYKLIIHGYPTINDLDSPVKIKVANKVIYEGIISSNEAKQIEFTLDKSDFKHDFIHLVQNAGNILLSHGYSKDRGSLVKKIDGGILEFYERDSKHFDKKAKLLAACGAACLIKKEVINKIGFLDGTYFMYYEDTDFSFRAWRAGWDIIYEPKAVVYHKHKASTNLQSLEFFLHMVEKNHMAFMITHFPMNPVITEMIKLLSRTFVNTVKYHILKFRDNIERTNILRIKSKAQLHAVFYIINNLSQLCKNRIFWNKRAVRKYKEAKEYIY